MKRIWTGGFAAVLVATTLIARVAAAPDTDPQAVLAEINKWYAEQYTPIRAAQDQAALIKLNQERIQKAKTAVAEFNPTTVEPAKALALAMLYQVAQMRTEQIAAAERFLTSNPAPDQKYQAQLLLLSAYNLARDANKLKETLASIEAPTPSAAASVASMMGNSYYQLIAEKINPQTALDLLNKLESQVPFDKFLTPEEKMQADSVIYSVASGRADLLKRLGRSGLIAPALVASRQRLSENSRYLRSLDAKIKQITLVGAPAPEIKRERGYGQFTGLESLKGKVVVLDFFAHWCPPCKAAFPAIKKSLAELGPKGLEVVGVTTYYGYYEKERNLTPDAEFAKMEGFIAQHGISWPVAYVDRATFDSYGVSGIPHYAVLDRSGKLKSITIGYNEELHAQLEKSVKEALAESPAAQ